jgi:hypothetical protein
MMMADLIIQDLTLFFPLICSVNLHLSPPSANLSIITRKEKYCGDVFSQFLLI